MHSKQADAVCTLYTVHLASAAFCIEAKHGNGHRNAEKVILWGMEIEIWETHCTAMMTHVTHQLKQYYLISS